ncbi:Histone acetyltransferase HAC12 [Cocos nucifera]|uniref:histone acetyltransferase n=1 Tax=Cocos nucifera TaxID=13894 RepID=A0A8K0NA66_COCNU|nr:Histone acetyltransferase HAC12 [Cocos nucifera]
MTNQASPQLPGLSQHNGNPLHSQVQNLGPLGMDPELLAGRRAMRENIYNYLKRRNHPSSDDWLRRLPELARRLEDRIFKDAARKVVSKHAYLCHQEDYMRMVMEPVEHHLQLIMKSLPNHSQSLSHNITYSSSPSTMILTPGISHNGSTSSVASCSTENSATAASGAGMGIQTTANLGNLLPTGNNLTDVGHSVSFNASNGPISNGYQHQPANGALGSGGSNISVASMGTPRQLSQMIPTPGFNSSQAVLMNSGCSSGVGFSSTGSTVAPQSQQPCQYVGSQNSHMLHTFGGQIGAGMRSNLQQKPSAYGFTNGLISSGLGLIGSNMQLVNGPAASEGFLSTAHGGSSPKPVPQHFNQQHLQQRIPTSLSQQILPIVGDGYSMKGTGVAGSIHGAGLSALSAKNNLSMNTAGLNSKSIANSALLSHRASLQSMQQPPHIRTHTFDHSQKVNFQSNQSTHENLLQSQQQMQQSQQQPNQPCVQYQHQESQRHQQLMLKNDTLRRSSMTPNLSEQLMTNTVVSHDESVLPQGTEQVHLPELQGQNLQNTSADDHAKSAQLLGHLSGSQGLHASFSQGSQQLLHPHKQDDEFQKEISCLSSGSQPVGLLQVHCQSHMLDKSSLEKHIQEELHQRSVGQDEAQQPHTSLEGCITSSAATTVSVAVPQFPRGVTYGPENSTQKRNYLNQRRWLLFLYHARWCSAPQGKCQEPNCIKAQDLVRHMNRCDRKECPYPRCLASKRLANHFRTCEATECPVCIPVREYIASNRKACAYSVSDPGLVSQANGSWISINIADSNRMKRDTVAVETFDDQQSLPKRMRVQHISPSVMPKSEHSPVPVPPNQPRALQEELSRGCEETEVTMSTKSDVIEVKIDMFMPSGHEDLSTFGNGIDGNLCITGPDIDRGVSNDVDGHVKQENLVFEKGVDQDKTVKQETNDPQTDPTVGSKSGKPKIKGVSLTELFTPEQIREHIVGLRQWIGQSKAKAEKNQAMEHSMSENSCQLCAVEKLTFDPPPIYCTPCGARIKRNAMYYTIGSGETRHYFCIPCYNEARGETIEVDGSQFQKAKLEKKRNDEETEEWWVQCDKCEAWQHQICALFNGRRNDGGQAEYTCPNCYIEEIERSERKPLPQSAVLGAKDLPRTILSDHIEQRLFRCLKQERQERARHLGKNVDEVPGAEGLVIRVVSSVDKKLEVKQRFLEIFQEENYPTEFAYKSKAILLFQRIEGVEVCLFGMYVQEFGSECPFPNQRRVYLSYLDSVKYFRPEIKTVTGEALRTFVYHEILIGYLEYCKKRGFTSCYIWACPPLKGEDYILYCHPEIQKTPKSDKLRDWYLSMLRKAAKENIVVDLTNLYDHFFVTMGECKAKVTAARLPYFDGDYWPGAAEDMINQLRQEEDDRKQQKKGKIKKNITKRALKAAGQADLTGNASKDALLMHKLGETICPMKEDFIMVHLQHACTHCCLLMVSGTRWVCNQCKNFQLCDKCHDAEQRLEEKDMHPINSREKHVLCPVEVNDVAPDTKDKDEILESEFFDTRQAFLSLCQGNHYQYDTLRRAKHSSMMVLYHLHNPTAPAFVTTCNICHHDIEAGQGWRCEVCPDYDVCNTCYQKGGIDHPHKLTNHPSMADQNAQNKEARQQRVLQVEVNDVAPDTKDKDEILESEFFDTRQAFLSLCQGNHYQYDTLRRAKHSSMMVLYHLHNPTAPAFVTTCNICHHDIEAGQGWRCEVCPDYDVCNTCYQKGGIDHPHKLTNHPSMADQNAQNKEARQQRVLQLRKMLDLLVHASQCRFPHCQYPNCRKVKGLFRHGIHCKTRASGGCVLCKKMWYLLQLHARACKESECSVPRCRDLKEHLRRLQQQSDSRRRAAVMEMMRQRAAEVAGNNG